MTKHEDSLRRPLIVYAFLYRWPWRLLILLLSLGAAVVGLASPYFQKLFIDALTAGESWGLTYFNTDYNEILFLSLAFVFLVCQQAFSLLASYTGVREGVHLQRVLSEALYKHTLGLRTESLNQRPIGEVVSIYATDTQAATLLLDNAIPAGANVLFPVLLAPIAIYWLFDIPLLYSLLTVAVLAAVNFLMAYRQSKFFAVFKELAAQRTGMANEWVQNIRTLRILGWVPSFEKRVFEKRQEETTNRIRMVTNGQMMNSLASSVTFALNVLALWLLVQLKESAVTAGELLALLWILGVFLTRPFRQMPWFFVFIFDALTSLKRIEDYLNQSNKPKKVDLTAKALADQEQASLSVRGLNLELGGKKLLRGVDFDIAPGEFVAIVGEVGAGKSLLLLSLMGETSADFEAYRIGGQDMRFHHQEELKKNFSYVPQEGFVMTASLRENVYFEYLASHENDPEILEALQRAQFNLDQENVHGGLSTEIGERGVNLSGGQRQRVSLARAKLNDAPIVLMDDCLSAVDIETEEGLITDLITGVWSNKTRLLVTHRLSVLKTVERILFLKQGQIQATGHFQELVDRSPAFNHFVQSLLREQAEEQKRQSLRRIEEGGL